MKKIIGFTAATLGVLAISCQQDQDLAPVQDVLNEKSAQIVVNEISVDNAMADINFESDFFIGAEDMMMGFGELEGGMHGGMGGGMMGGGMMGGSFGNMHGHAGEWNQGEGMRYMMGQGPQYSMHGNQGQYPDSLVMDYGMGTQLGNGRMLSGQMIIHTNGEQGSGEFSRQITYNNFSVDSMMVSGNSTMTILGDHETGSLHMVTEDILLTFPDGTTVHRQSEITRRWVEGENTPLTQTDDMMEVTGYVTNTINENGTETVYRKEIMEPLVKTANCRYFSSGMIEITTDGTLMATLDYGNGDCDDVALLTETGKDPVEISLPDNDHCANEQGMGADDDHNTGNGMGMGMGNAGTGMGQGNSGNGTGMGNSGTGMGQGNNGSGMGQGNTGTGTGMGNSGSGMGTGRG